MLPSKGMHLLGGGWDKGRGLNDVLHSMASGVKNKILFQSNGYVNISALKKIKHL
jgi:hypothetical protein